MEYYTPSTPGRPVAPQAYQIFDHGGAATSNARLTDEEMVDLASLTLLYDMGAIGRSSGGALELEDFAQLLRVHPEDLVWFGNLGDKTTDPCKPPAMLAHFEKGSTLVQEAADYYIHVLNLANIAQVSVHSVIRTHASRGEDGPGFQARTAWVESSLKADLWEAQ